MSQRYVKQKVLGRGNYGSAHLVKDVRSGGWFVMKEVALEGLDDRARKSALSEAALLAHLKHVFIVTYRDSFTSKNHLYIVMEYCEGGDLSRMVKQQRKAKKYFSEAQVMDWFCQMTSAIAFCHSKRVLHRDLKPGNIFLTSTNQVKLGDFGIARVLENTMDKAQTVAGTPYFMSPEVCENKPYGPESDMWALGCILYEMCTLKHPFEATNLLGLVFKIVTDTPKRIPDHFSQSLWDLISWMLNKDPSKRPSAAQVQQHELVLAAAHRLADGGSSHPAALPEAPAPAPGGAAAGATGTSSPLAPAPAPAPAPAGDGLTHRERIAARKAARVEAERAKMAAAAVANAAESARTAATYSHRHTSSSLAGLGGSPSRPAGVDVSGGGRYGENPSGRTPRRGGGGTGSSTPHGTTPATAPAASGGGVSRGPSPASDRSGASGRSAASSRSRAPSQERPIVSTGLYDLDGATGVTPRADGPTTTESAPTPGAHRRKSSGGASGRISRQGSGNLPSGPPPRAHSEASANPGFAVTPVTPRTGGVGVVVRRTPRGSGRASRPVSAGDLMQFQTGTGGVGGAQPRAASSLATLGHGGPTAPSFAMQDEEEEYDGADDGFFGGTISSSYVDMPTPTAGGLPASTPVAGARGGSRAGAVVAARPGRAPSAPASPPAPAPAFDPTSTVDTVYTDFGTDEYDVEGVEEALDLPVPGYQREVVGTRNKERTAMMELMRSQVDVTVPEEVSEGGEWDSLRGPTLSTAPHAAAAPRVAPGAGGSTPAAQSGRGAPLEGTFGAAGGDEPAAVQIDMIGMVKAESKRQQDALVKQLGEGLFDTAKRFWKDAYAKGGGPEGLAKPSVAARVKSAIEGMCGGNDHKVAAFYQVEALTWADFTAAAGGV